MQKILIWGTGQIAKNFIDNIDDRDVIKGFIETMQTIDFFEGKTVFLPETIPNDYDYIVVANTFPDEIYRTCHELKINLENVIFMVKGVNTSFNDASDIEKCIGEKNYTNYLAQYGRIDKSFFYNDLEKYNLLNKRDNFIANSDNLWPIIYDKYSTNSGQGNYFWQDLWAATKIIKKHVSVHYDIGSRVDGFIAHLLAAGIRVNMIDIRKIPVEHDLLKTIIADATKMEHIQDNSIDSLSALCSLEHFGLGRYGDEIDPEACFVVFKNICKKMKCGGNLYISVPIGQERVEFNAHRVFFARTIINCFSSMELIEYSCVANNYLEENVEIDKYDNDPHNGNYRYGLFHFIKK